MKPLKSFLLIAFAMVLSVSCKQQTKESSLEKELMDKHDVQMEKMEKTHQLRKSLTMLENDSTFNEEQKAEIQSKIELLKEADKSMMNWMREYSRPDSAMNMDAQKAYFEAELVKMETVKSKMNEGIEEGQKCLEKYESIKK